MTDSGTLKENGADAGDVGHKNVVGEGGTGTGSSKGGGVGSSRGGGVRRYGGRGDKVVGN